MIIKALTLENFKGIREPVRIEFAPLTLLFGPNNAGKSTIVQAFMYAREVLERNNTDVRQTQLGGEVVDLGGFQNLVYGHDLNRTIRMRFELDLRPSGLPDRFNSVFNSPDLNNDGITELYNFQASPLTQRDMIRATRARASLTDVWVEFEIVHGQSSSNRSAMLPIVRRYSVGTGDDRYATIEFDIDGAYLGFLNFGIPPFGNSYSKGDASNFEWDFSRIARYFFRHLLYSHGSRELGLNKGATVAMKGEDVGFGENRISRADFDRQVLKIINGDGEWGDATLDSKTGKPNPKYAHRQKMIEQVEAVGRYRTLHRELRKLFPEYAKKWGGSDYGNDYLHSIESFAINGTLGVLGVNSGSASVAEKVEYVKKLKPHLSLPNGERDRELYLSIKSYYSGLWPESEAEKESREWDLCDKSIYSDFNSFNLKTEGCESWLYDRLEDGPYGIPPFTIGGGNLAYQFPLKMIHTALPDWTRRLEFLDRKYDPHRDSELGERKIKGYLLDFLDSIIVEPGRILLEELQGSLYLGPFRKLPSRHYRPSSATSVPDWASGLAAWDRLVEKDSQPLVDSVNEWLFATGRFDTGYRIEVERFKKLDVNSSLWKALLNDDLTGQEASIRQELANLPEENNKLNFVNAASGVVLAPHDLGTGISQVLPVIVAALNKTSGVAAIEEPESNIHPAFQVILGDLFLSQAKANPNRLFLVETHSEHLVLRIMRRMRETYQGKQAGDLAASPADVSILYVERNGERTLARSMPLNALGELVKAWPGGFFEESLREQFGDD